MMFDNELQKRDIVADYWRAYFEWRAAYGLSDTCMGELLAALRVEAEESDVDPEQRAKLLRLAKMIEMELSWESETRCVA